MNELSDKDWERINAYHDGELGEAEMRELETRIAAEPALALALTAVRGVSASLSALRPELVGVASGQDDAAANDNRHPGRWLAGGAVAAAIALAVAFGPSFLAEPTAFDIHADFAEQSFAIENGDLRPVAVEGLAGAPDLSSANLTPVASRTSDQGQVTHYVGRNGCRLTYFRGAFGLGDPSRSRGEQLATWTTADNLRHMVVATGMDQAKFDAIANYMKLVTRQQSTESVLAAVSDATTAAAPCVG